MNQAQAFAQGQLACEVDGCVGTATSLVQDLGSVYGTGPFPIDIVPVGPLHIWCDLHKREHHSYQSVDGEWVRF